MSLFDTAASTLGHTITTRTGSGALGSMANSAAMSAVSKYVPSAITKGVKSAEKIASDLATGNLLGAAGDLINTGILNGVLGGLAGTVKQAIYWASPTPLFGGVSPAVAKAMHNHSVGIDYAQKNLFVIEVNSLVAGDFSDRFNFLASSVEYSPSTITASKIKVGAATTDSVTSSEPTDLTIVTLDDANGTIKNWFNDHVRAIVSSDGTVGLPGFYAIKIKIVHAVIRSSFGVYEDLGLFRPTSMSVSLDRREDALQEITMTFSQLDTFMVP